MVSRIRRSIAVAVALVVTMLTLGRVPLDWSGSLGARHDGEPARPSAAWMKR